MDLSERIAASIVTYRTSPDELQTAVADLNAAGVCHIVVVDNSPTESLRPLCEDMGVEYVYPGANLGYGAAHNIALRRSLENPMIDYHLVMNSDIRFGSDTIRRITAHMDAHKDIGQLIPRVNYPDGRLQPSVRMLPTPLDVIGRRFLPGWMMRGRDRRYTLAFWDHASEADIPYHQGSFMFLRTEALRSEGLFDERFFMYPEDIDLTRRIHRHWRTVYWPGASIVHHHRAASYRSWRMTWIHVTNMSRYFNKWGWFHDPERRRENRRLLSTLVQKPVDKC